MYMIYGHNWPYNPLINRPFDTERDSTSICDIIYLQILQFIVFIFISEFVISAKSVYQSAFSIHSILQMLVLPALSPKKTKEFMKDW